MTARGDDLHTLLVLIRARVTLVIGTADYLLAFKASVSQSIHFVFHFPVIFIV
jgi:hypothetical protein